MQVITPTERFVLNSKDPVIQEMVINFCRKNQLPVYEGTTCFDPQFPYLVWDNSINMLTQTQTLSSNSLDLESFMKKFLKSDMITIDLNEKYKAVVSGGSQTVQVGCQIFSFAKIEELYNAVQKLKTNTPV